MAQLGNKKIFSGMAGNVVFRNLNGRQIAQSRPFNVKHSQTQKKSASEFGNCSRWAKHIRKVIDPLLLGLTDSYMYQRFTKAVSDTIRESELPQGERTPLTADMQSLAGFEFNINSLFADYFKPELEASFNDNREMIIMLPAFNAGDNVSFPNYCSNAKLILYAIATDFKETTIPLAFHNVTELTENGSVPAQTVLSTTPIPADYFVLAAAKLLFYKRDVITGVNYLNTKTLSPAKVVFAGA